MRLLALLTSHELRTARSSANERALTAAKRSQSPRSYIFCGIRSQQVFHCQGDSLAVGHEHLLDQTSGQHMRTRSRAVFMTAVALRREFTYDPPIGTGGASYASSSDSRSQCERGGVAVRFGPRPGNLPWT